MEDDCSTCKEREGKAHFAEIRGGPAWVVAFTFLFTAYLLGRVRRS